MNFTVLIQNFNGTKDPGMPFEGGNQIFAKKKIGEIVSTPELAKFWAKKNKCSLVPKVTLLPDKNKWDGSTVKVETYSSKTLNGAEVIVYAIQNGGHTWPGGKQYAPKWMIGNTNRDIDGTKVIWDFFKKYQLKNSNK